MWRCSIPLLFLATALAASGSRVSIDARDTEIIDVVQQLSAQAQFDVVVGPGVKGKVTLFVSDIDVGEALEALASAGGWAVHRMGGVYRFVTRDEYERITGQRFAAEMRTKVFTVQHVSAVQVASALGPLTSPGGRIVVDPEGNNIVVYDRPTVIDQMQTLMDLSDRPHETLAIPLHWIGAEEAARQATPLLGPSGHVTADAPGARLIVEDQPWRVARVQKLLDSLDIAPGRGPTYVELAHLDTDSIARLVARLQTVQPGRMITPVGDRGLLIEDSPAGMLAAREILSTIDSAATTVRVDAKILQVSVSREVSTGIDWQAIADRIDGLTFHGSFPLESSGPRFDADIGDIADNDYSVLISMLEAFGRVELIARPTLLTHSGQEAELMVGSRVPYVTTDTREDNAGTVSRYQRVTYLPVGLSMWVLPEAHRDGTISLSIRPELSSIADYVDAGDTRYPVVETTNARLSVTVLAGRSVVIGGLIRETKSTMSRGVPLLRSIPLLGALFRHQVDETKRAELVILLTPKVSRADGSDPAE